MSMTGKAVNLPSPIISTFPECKISTCLITDRQFDLPYLRVYYVFLADPAAPYPDIPPLYKRVREHFGDFERALETAGSPVCESPILPLFKH
jgi:hypothetical protein